MANIDERRAYMVEWRRRVKLASKKPANQSNLAPPSYNHQICRERLARSVEACKGVAKFNPSGE